MPSENIGNVEHPKLGDGDHSTPENEVAEYFIQYRETDLVDLITKPVINIIMTEHPIFGNLLIETREAFRRHVRKGIILGYCYYTFDRDDKLAIATALKMFDKIQLKMEIEVDTRMNEINSSEHEDQIITFPCQVLQGTQKRSLVLTALFECNRCESDFTRISSDEGSVCRVCEKGKLEFVNAVLSEDKRRVTLREIRSDLTKSTPRQIIADIHGDLVNTIELGDKVIVTGIFKSVPLRKEDGQLTKNYIQVIDVINIQRLEDRSDLMPSPDLLKRFNDLEAKGELKDLVIKSFAYHIYKKYDEKTAVILAILGGERRGEIRGIIHVLFVGDPGTAKSEIMKTVLKVSPRSAIADSTNATKAGLIASGDKMDDGRLAVTPGVLPLCNGASVFIDEFSKLGKDNMDALRLAMENEYVNKKIGGNDFEASCKTSILASMNPSDEEWNPARTIKENLEDIPIPVLTRLDLKFRFIQVTDPIDKKAISEHINKTAEKRPAGLLSYNELMLFFNYAKKLKPILTEDAKKVQEEFFNSIPTTKNDSMAMAFRDFNALGRLAIAFAKWHLKETADRECMNEAIDLYKQSLQSFGLDIIEGEGINEYTLEKTSEGRIKAMKNAFSKLGRNTMGYVFEDELIDEIVKYGIFEDKNHIKNTINKLHISGDISKKDNMLKYK